MGVDDYVVEHGEAAFIDAVNRAMQPEPELRSLDDVRAQMRQDRVDSLEHPAVYADTSPPGVGKSYAGADAMQQAATSLTVVKTHSNATETAETFRQIAAIDVVPYPQLSPKNCERFDEAAKVLDSGLSVTGAICMGSSVS